MGKKAADPTIRVLMLGAPGVGKNCLESRVSETLAALSISSGHLQG